MYKFHNLNKLNICYDMTTGNNNGGGAGETVSEPSGDTTGEGDGLDDLTLDNLDDDLNNDEQAEENNEEQKGEKNDELDFENLFDEEGNINAEIDATKYEALKEVGINIDSPTFKQQINELNELGVTDPQAQMNILKKARENELKEANKTPEEIKAQLNKELYPEARRNYKAINNVVKEIWGNNPEVYKAIMTDSVAINMMAKLHEYYKGSQPADVTPTNTKPTESGYDTSQAEKAYQKLMAEAYSKGKGYELRDKVIEKVLSKTSPRFRKEVEQILGYNK